MVKKTLILAGLAIGAAGMASAATMKYHAALTPGAEVPPTKSTGSGEATATLDTATHQLTYDVTYEGLNDVTAGHIHGPAGAGKNAGVLIPFQNASKSPIHGTTTLTPDQEKDLQSGQMYVNIHTAQDKAGAIRGQLMPEK